MAEPNDQEIEKALIDFLDRKTKLWRWPVGFLIIMAAVLLSLFNFDVYKAKLSLDETRTGIETERREIKNELDRLSSYRDDFRRSLSVMNSALDTLLELTAVLGVQEEVIRSPENLKNFLGDRVEGILFRKYLENLRRFIINRSIELQTRFLSDKEFTITHYRQYTLAMQYLVEGISRFTDLRKYQKEETKRLLETSVTLYPELAPARIWLAHYIIIVEMIKTLDLKDAIILADGAENHLRKAESITLGELRKLEGRYGNWLARGRVRLSQAEQEDLDTQLDVNKKLYAHLLGVRSQLFYYKSDIPSSKLKQFDDALRNAESATEFDSQNPRYYNLAAFAAFRNNEFKKAVNFWHAAVKKAKDEALGDYAVPLNSLAHMYIEKAKDFPGNAWFAVQYATRAVQTNDPKIKMLALDSLAAALYAEPLKFSYEALLTQWKAVQSVSDLPDVTYPKRAKDEYKINAIKNLHKYSETVLSTLKARRSEMSGYDLHYREGTTHLLLAASCWDAKDLVDLKSGCNLDEILQRSVLAIISFKRLQNNPTVSRTELGVKLGHALALLSEASKQEQEGSTKINDISAHVKRVFEETCNKVKTSSKNGDDCNLPEYEALYASALEEVRSGTRVLSEAGVPRSAIANAIVLNNWAWQDYLQNKQINDITVERAILAAYHSDWEHPAIIHTVGSLLEKRGGGSEKEFLRGWAIVRATYCSAPDGEIKELYERYLNKLKKQRFHFQHGCPKN